MDYYQLHEEKVRGRPGFPVELYSIDKDHPRYQMPPHWHVEYELIHVLSGQFILYLDGSRYVMEADDCILVPDGVIHGGVPKDCVYECLVCDPAGVDPQATLSGLAAAPGYLLEKGSRPHRLAGELFQEIAAQAPGHELVCYGLFLELLGHLRRANTELFSIARHRQIDSFKKVLSYIRHHYAEPLTLADLAENANMVPRYFCRAFASVIGRTPIDYLNFYRVECASQRLLQTGDSVTEVGLACGFNNVCYFSRIFRKYKSISPSEFRGQHQKAPA